MSDHFLAEPSETDTLPQDGEYVERINPTIQRKRATHTPVLN
jgi:hypothetical protein